MGKSCGNSRPDVCRGAVLGKLWKCRVAGRLIDSYRK